MADGVVVMGVASYRSRAAAEADFGALWAGDATPSGARLVAALVERGANGQLIIDRQWCPTLEAPWSGPVLGSALVVVAAPLGLLFLIPVVQSGADLGGICAITGHFWHNVAKEELRRMSEALETGQAALVLVAGDESAQRVSARLTRAELVVTATTSADFDRDYAIGVEEARAIG